MKENWLKKKKADKESLKEVGIDDPDYTIPEEYNDSENRSIHPNENINEGIAHSEEKCPEDSELDLIKKGTKRKRRKFNTSRSIRQNEKKAKIIDAHQVKEPCTQNCRMKCRTEISEERRLEINHQFWKLSPKNQRWFIFKNTGKITKKRSTVSGSSSRRNLSFKYFLPKETGAEERTNVCKVFFLTTLGYKKSNDKVVRNVVTKSNFHPPEDNRGKHEAANKIDREIVKAHIESFRPQISHYRREHAPNRRYLPGDINQTLMYNHFRDQNPTFKLSYETYGNIVREMNISFSALGHEECWLCDKFKKHKQASGHNENNDNDCSLCKEWNTHNTKYVTAREKYKADVEKQNSVCFLADLQKVIMLPRCEMYKEVIFMERLIAYNESFVPVGKTDVKTGKVPFAVIWHEGISGSSQHDYASTFYAFFMHKRDEKCITLWLDNCSSQNKNWVLFCFFTYIVNSTDTSLEELEIKYFEPGHTFMSADSFHHQVELSLKKTKKVWDFDDFKKCVQQANSHRVEVFDMGVENFYVFKDCVSNHKLKKLNPRPYLSDMVHLRFKRGDNAFKYKNNFNEEDFIKVNFLLAENFKSGVTPPTRKNGPKGISSNKKKNIIKKLKEVAPTSRLTFWQSVIVNDDDS